MIEVTADVIDLATELRSRYGFKSPDAIHLASAIQADAALFLTADAALRMCQEIAVEVVVPSHT